MYILNIITQTWVYLLITLAKQRTLVGKSDRIYERLSETVPEQFFGSYVVVSYNYKAVRLILESCVKRVILTAISDTFIKLTYCHLALLYKILSKQFLFLNFDHFKSCR